MRNIKFLVSIGLLSFQIFANTALVIIDMQPDFREGYYMGTEENLKAYRKIINNQKLAIRLAKLRNMPILFVEYNGFKKTVKDLTNEVKGYHLTHTIKKSSDGLFDDETAKAQVVSKLNEWNAKNLIIMGANAMFCVRCTITGATKNGFNVTAYSAGITDFTNKIFHVPFVYRHDIFREISCESEKCNQVTSLEDLFGAVSSFEESIIALTPSDLGTSSNQGPKSLFSKACESVINFYNIQIKQRILFFNFLE